MKRDFPHLPAHSVRRVPRLLVMALVFFAFALRVWHLDSVPPGWRDDELINSLVISQKALDGDIAPYYPDASGHEALYHLLNAVPLALFGPGALGIRLLSAYLGTLTIPLTYVLAKRLLGSAPALLSAAALTVSFWSLMYSRVGLRHVLTPLLCLAAFYFFWRGLQAASEGRSQVVETRNWLLSAIAMGLGFYTYFASRGVPLILLAFTGYLWLFDRALLRRIWRQLLLMFGATIVLIVPLLVTLNRQPASEARVSELAVPLVEARTGNFAPLWDHIRVTLNMFHADGDGEWLYNIPHRPLFGSVGAIFFWTGVAVAAWYALQPFLRLRYRRAGAAEDRVRSTEMHVSRAGIFLLLWWLAGISPGFISLPPASLGHTIVAQPAVYLLMALGGLAFATPNRLWRALRTRFPSIEGAWQRYRKAGTSLLALLLLGVIGWRDLTSYFQDWPDRGMVRFLYRADIRDVAGYLNQNRGINDFSISGLLAGPWDRIALLIDLDDARSASVRPRWFDPRRAALLQPPLSFNGFPEVSVAYASSFVPVPEAPPIGGYQLSRAIPEKSDSQQVCFENGLCWVSAVYHRQEQQLELTWYVKEELDLPEMPLISNPPPPGVYAGPRLLVFAQFHDESGRFLTGDDGLWVDPGTLHPGDVFIQQHKLSAAADARPTSVVFGLYDPMTDQRVLTEDGRDQLRLELEE